MENLIAPKGIKLGIFRCLKAGINPEFPEQGTPQGGVVSPLLANIALNGIERIHRIHRNGCKISKNTPKVNIQEPSFRYADDMVIILKPEDDATKTLARIDKFLAERGMKVSAKKTKITNVTDGFDFLGWNFKVQTSKKLKIVPSVNNFKAFRLKVKKIVNNSNYGSKVKAEKLAPIVRGWRNYHRFCDMSSARNSLWFINHRTWKVFNKESKNDRYSTNELIKKAFPTVPYSENRHTNVTGNKSPYDGDIIYWSERNSKLYDGQTSKVLKRQNHSCGQCGVKNLGDEPWHLHHIDGNHNNWKPKNLIVVHQSCHQNGHMGKREQKP